MKRLIAFTIITCSLLGVGLAMANSIEYPLEKAFINPHNQASLQRGAKLFMNYCAGCHSLKYMRYNGMAEGIGIIDDDGNVLKDLVVDNLIFTGAKITDPIKAAINKRDAKEWFGVAPPDLSLIIREHGVNWVYTYLLNFYHDPSRPLGTNNLLVPGVAMPNVLVNLQGIQIPVYKHQEVKVQGGMQDLKEVDHLEPKGDGMMTPGEFASAVNDIANFLNYVSEPTKIKRQKIGIWVLFFVIILAIFTYLLKREYWKDVKQPPPED